MKYNRIVKDPFRFILNVFGYDYNNKPSLLRDYIQDVTHENWLHSLQRKNQVEKYEYNLYLK
jgi:hypothetical protein